MTDITDEMIDRGAVALSTYQSNDPDQWKWYREHARLALEAGLAGRALVDLPESDGYDRWAKGHIAVLAYPAGGTHSEVELIVGGAGQGMSADRAESLGLMLVAAALCSRERTQSSGVAGDPR